MNGDSIIKATAGRGSIRAFFANTLNTVEEARKIHKTSPVATAALGRILSAASMMGSMLKGDDLLTLQIKSDGPLEGIVVTSNSQAQIKGYVYEPLADVPLKPDGKLNVGAAIGSGTFRIIKDMGLKEPYVGQVKLVSGEIADDLTHYYATSEQIPTSVALGVLIDRDYSVKQSGGFIIQLMPDADDYIIDKLEKRLTGLPPLTSILDIGKSMKDIMEIIMGDFEPIINEILPIRYCCNCSRERVERSLLSIGAEELNRLLMEDNRVKIHCHFCGKDYIVDENRLHKLIEFIKTM